MVTSKRKGIIIMKKKVLLLGDSIRQGYQEYVKEHLKDVADVYYPNDNGRYCQMTLRYFHDWARILSDNWSFDFEIIHFNSRLWDILRLSNEDECFNSSEQYKELLMRIVNRMRYFYPKAKIIFALTTKIEEPGFTYGSDIAVRKNSDILRYNEIARDLFGTMDIMINDLWTVSVNCSENAMSDNVHFNTSEGEKKLGGAVCSCIRKYCS